jgi:hypothetical protein
MTNLEQFLNKEKEKKPTVMEPASGSFTCQQKDCNEVVFEGFIDRDTDRLSWFCSNNHESSVVI